MIKAAKKSIRLEGTRDEVKGALDMLTAYYGQGKKMIDIIKEVRASERSGS